jgi:hypothetical protein
MKSERVYTVADYYDGPRSGVADFEGQPHTFDAIFDEAAEEWSDIFLLQRIDPATLDLVLADWASWLRWQAAHDRGEVGLDTHPVLPAERAKHDVRFADIRRRLDARTEPTERRRGRFEGSRDSLRVTWLT